MIIVLLKLVPAKTVRKRRAQLPAPDSGNEFTLISALLPTLNSVDDEPDSETDDVLREATLLLLRLTFAQAHAQLESMTQELDLLRSALFLPAQPEQSADDSRTTRRLEEEDMWRLDKPLPRSRLDGRGPLLDEGGKVTNIF